MLKHAPDCQCSVNKKFQLKITGHYPTSCERSKLEVIHLPTPLPLHASKYFFYHQNCIHNALSALIGRVAKCVPSPTPARLDRLLTLSQMLGKSLGSTIPITYEQVIESYRGFRKKRYERAYNKIQKFGFNFDPTVSMFVKMEGISYSANKVNPDCRAIQFRKPEFGLTFGKYIKPIEHKLYGAKGPKPFPSTQFIAKNLNPVQRAQLMKLKYAAMSGCVIYEFDVSRFDAHVTEMLIDVEQAFYKAMNSDAEFAQLLKLKKKSKGKIRGDTWAIKYSLRGGRMSGDMDTASSNCVIMATVLAYLGETIEAVTDFIVDGDDSVFFCSNHNIPDEFFYTFFKECGLTIKIDNKTVHLHEVTFCQSRLVELDDRDVMIRDPIKLMSKLTINPKFSEVDPYQLLEVICLGELSIISGCPVIDPFVRKMLQLARVQINGRNKMKGSKDWMDYRQRRDVHGDWWKLKVTPITPQARLSFMAAWGWSIYDQHEFESMLDKIDIDLNSELIHDEGIDVVRWLTDCFMREFSN